MEELTKQDQEFVKEIAITGNGTQSVKKAYKNKHKTDNAAAVKAHELLRNPKIIDAIDTVKKTLADQIPDSLLVYNNLALFEQKRLDYFVFPKTMEDEEIIAHVNANGIEVITVRMSDKGKMAFYSMPDAQAIAKGLDFGYKLKGSYAPDKSVNLNVNAEMVATSDLQDLAQQLNDIARNNNRPSIPSNGTDSNVVDAEIQG